LIDPMKNTTVGGSRTGRRNDEPVATPDKELE